MNLPCVQQRTDRGGFWHGKQRDRATHRRNAIERQPFARHLGRLLSILPHHFHAVGAHLRNRSRRHNHTRTCRRSGLLAEEAQHSSEQEQDLKCAFHNIFA